MSPTCTPLAPSSKVCRLFLELFLSSHMHKERVDISARLSSRKHLKQYDSGPMTC